MGAVNYGWDVGGRRTSVAATGTNAPTLTYLYDAADQVVGWSYDNAGNLLSDGTATYTYDPLERLKTATAGGTTSTYAYNGDDALATKAVGGIITRYTLDTQGGLSERLGQTAGGVASTNRGLSRAVPPAYPPRPGSRCWIRAHWPSRKP